MTGLFLSETKKKLKMKMKWKIKRKINLKNGKLIAELKALEISRKFYTRMDL